MLALVFFETAASFFGRVLIARHGICMSKSIRRAPCLIALFTSLALARPVSAQTRKQTVSIPPTVFDNDMVLGLRSPSPLSRNEEAALRPLVHFRECKRCPEMVVIPPGKFLMGSSTKEFGSPPDERPQHEVSLRRFAIALLPVSLDEWNACFVEKWCSFQPTAVEGGLGRQFAGSILWEEAKEYAQWLSRTTGRTYRLLSEAEREYVARASTTTAYWWGDSSLHAESAGGQEIHLGSSQVNVGLVSVAANPWGLLDVHGSVYDWVEDCWHENYDGAPKDGTAWMTGDCRGHVLRGGAFSRSAQTRRSAARFWSGSPNRLFYMSVRVARTLTPSHPGERGQFPPTQNSECGPDARH